MRFDDLREAALPLGQLTTWRATAATLAAAAEQPADPRGPSHNQYGHIADALTRRVDPDLIAQVTDPSGKPGRAAPTGWIGVSFDVPHLNLHYLRRAFEAWVGRHETLRSGFRPSRDGVDAPFDRFTLEASQIHLEPVDLGTFIDHDALAGELEDLFNRSTDAVRWPSYALCAIRTARTTTVVLAFDHVNIDGYSILLAVGELRELLDADHEGRPADLDPVPSYVDFAQEERSVAAEATPSHHALEPWRTLLGPDGTLPAFPLPDGLAPGSQLPQETACLPILTEAESDAFGAWCRSRGASSAAGFLGALALAFDRCEQAEAVDRDGQVPTTFRSLVSTHTRHTPWWAEALGWFTAIAPLSVDLTPGEGLATQLGTIAQAWADAKRGAALPMSRVAELLDVPLHPRFVLSYLDARHARGARQWQTWNAQAYLGDVGPTDEVYVWINRVPGETYLTWRHPGNAVCRAQIDEVTTAMRQIILDALTTDTETTPTQEEHATWL